MKRLPTIIVLIAAMTAGLAGVSRAEPIPTQQFRPKWHVSNTWTVQTQSRQQQMAGVVAGFSVQSCVETHYLSQLGDVDEEQTTSTHVADTASAAPPLPRQGRGEENISARRGRHVSGGQNCLVDGP